MYPLVTKGDFSRVFEQGSKFPTTYLVLYAHRNMLAHSRLGLAVSRKLGTAVVRNKIRRRLRESLRKQLAAASLHCDFVIVARQAAADADFNTLDTALRRCLSRLYNETNSHIADKTV